MLKSIHSMGYNAVADNTGLGLSIFSSCYLSNPQNPATFSENSNL